MLFRDADKTSIARFEQWHESLDSSQQEKLSRMLFRADKSAGHAALFTAFAVFDEKDSNFPPPIHATIDLAMLLKGSVTAQRLLTNLPKDHQITIRRNAAKLGRRYFTAYLIALKISGNSKPQMISQDQVHEFLKLTDSAIPESMGSREFLETVREYRIRFRYKGLESFFLLLRSIYGESNTMDLARRIISEDLNVEPDAVISLLSVWDDVKHLPMDWSLKLIPELSEDDNS